MNTQRPPAAREFMNSQVHTVPPDMHLSDVVAFLLKHGISNAPVVLQQPSGERRLLGFLSERDCLEFLSNEMFFGNPSQPQTAGTIMQRHPVCVESDTDIFTLASIFTSHGYRHLPVVDGTNFQGIVSRRDILKALDKYYRERLQSAESERNESDLERITDYRFVARRMS